MYTYVNLIQGFMFIMSFTWYILNYGLTGTRQWNSFLHDYMEYKENLIYNFSLVGHIHILDTCFCIHTCIYIFVHKLVTHLTAYCFLLPSLAFLFLVSDF